MQKKYQKNKYLLESVVSVLKMMYFLQGLLNKNCLIFIEDPDLKFFKFRWKKSVSISVSGTPNQLSTN